MIGHARTAASVDALVAAMKKIGLNELVAGRVFSGRRPTSPARKFRPRRFRSDEQDILAEALKQTEGTGITVYADLSLLTWGDAPPEAARDLSIEGETSREMAVHARDRAQEPDFDDDRQ